MNDPKREYCGCGYSFIPSIYDKIVCLIKGARYKRCPRCGCRLELRMSHFVYIKDRKVIDKKELWRKG